MTSNVEFYNALAKKESGGHKNPYAVTNSCGFVGKYQWGEGILIDLGYYKKNGSLNNKWNGTFTGKDGIKSLEDLKKKPEVQEKIIKEEMAHYWNQLEKNGAAKYIGKEINGVVITPSGLLAAAHLKGPTDVKNFLENPNNEKYRKDGYGTTIESYMHDMGGFDVSSETGIRDYDNKYARDYQETLDVYNGKTFVPDSFLEECVNKTMWPEFKEKVMPHFSDGKKYIGKNQPGEACTGSYYVSGYTTKDGKKVEGYTRDCWKHAH